MKKTTNKTSIIVILFAVIFICASTFTVGAENEHAQIYASSISQLDEKEMLIELSIKNNSGIMGFKLTLEYDKDKIEFLSSTKGAVTSIGNYSDNFGVKEDNCDIVWYNTSQVVSDGSISLIKCKLLTDDPFSVDLSISQADTFDENWNDVKISCENISFNSDKADDNPDGNTGIEETQSIDASSDDFDSSFIITDILDEGDVEDINNIDNNISSAVLDETNKQVYQITGQENYYSNFDDLIDDYQKDLYENLISDLDSLDTDVSIDRLIDDFKNNKGKKSLDETDVEVLMNNFESLGLSDTYAKYLSKKQLLKGINQAYATQQNINNSQSGSDLISTWVISISVVAIVLIAGTLLLIKKRGVHKNES